jgi:hypothetical protein
LEVELSEDQRKKFTALARTRRAIVVAETRLDQNRVLLLVSKS